VTNTGALYRLTVPPVGSTGTKVEKLAITLPDAVLGADSEPLPPPPKKGEGANGLPPSVGAHGLLYAFDSLYVMVDEVPNRRGIWRLRDTDGDDQFERDQVSPPRPRVSAASTVRTPSSSRLTASPSTSPTAITPIFPPT